MKELNKTEKIEFASALTSVSAIYNHNLDKGATNIYWHILKDYGITPIKKALYSHLKDPEHGKFFPKPCDIIQRIDGKPSDKAILAWANVIKFLSDNSINGKPVIFDDPIIHYCVDVMGGLSKIKGAKSSEEGFKRKEFIDTYNAAMNDKASYVNNYSNILGIDNFATALSIICEGYSFISIDKIKQEIDECDIRIEHLAQINSEKYHSELENSIKLLKIFDFYSKVKNTVIVGDKEKCFYVLLNGKYKIHPSIDFNINLDRIKLKPMIE